MANSHGSNGSHNPVEPAAVPSYLEPFTHVKTTITDTSSIIQEITKSIKKLEEKKICNIVCEIKNCTIKGTAYFKGYEKIMFVMNIYKEGNQIITGHVIEYFAKTGNRQKCFELWKNIKSELYENRIINEPVSPTPRRALFNEIDIIPDDSQATKTAKKIKEMLSSDTYESIMHGLTFAQSKDVKIQEKLIENDVVSLLLKLIENSALDDNDIIRCAVAALSNLTKNRQNVCSMIEEKKGITLICNVIVKSSCLQIKREFADILKIIMASRNNAVQINLQEAITELESLNYEDIHNMVTEIKQFYVR